MLGNKILQLITVLVIGLILGMPVYVGGVYAQTDLKDVDAYGGDQVSDYIQASDVLTIIARARIDGDDQITPEQMKLEIGYLTEYADFAECPSTVDEMGYFECKRVSDQYSRWDENQYYDYRVHLYDNEGNEITSVSPSPMQRVYVDNTIPTVDYLTAAQKHRNVTINFSVTDTAYGQAGVCSGLDFVEIYVNGDLAETIDDLDGCSKEILNYEFEVPGTAHGDFTFEVRVYDGLGHTGKLEREEEVDLLKPKINRFNITDSSGRAIEYISTLTSAVLKVRIEEKGDLTKAYADLSELVIDELRNGFTSVSTTCTRESETDYYNCNWNIPYLYVTSSVEKEIRIWSRDSFGNLMNDSVKPSFILDTTGPNIKEIKTNNKIGDIYYLGEEDNVITLDIEESGAGLGNRWIILDLSSLNSNYPSVYPNNCTKLTNSDWQCKWENVDVTTDYNTGDSLGVTARYGSIDDAGNDATGKTSVSFIYDEDAPVINKINITASAPSHLSEIKDGDYIDIIANVSEDYGNVKAFANVSDLVFGRTDPVEGVCTNEECRWEDIGVVSATGSKRTAQIYLTFIDAVGNSVTNTTAKTVYVWENATEPDYWSVGTITHSPSKIDRKIAELFPQRIYFHTPLIASSNIEIISTVVDCTAINNSDIYRGETLVNKNTNDMYIVAMLNSGTGVVPSDVNQLNLTCELKLVSKVNNRMITDPEVEEINLTIPFYNMPYGELSQNVRDEISDVKSSWVVQQKWIGSLSKWIEISKKMCGTVNLLAKIVILFNTIETGVRLVTDYKGPFHSIGVAIGAGDDALSVTFKGVFNTMGKYCGFISCSTEDPVFGGIREAEYEFIEKIPGLGATGTALGFSPAEYLQPEKSIYASILTLCIPGVLYNLEKERQIECQYIYCLEQEVPQNNIPLETCIVTKSYQECKYLYGGLFNLIPILAFFDYMTSAIKEILGDPLALFDATISAVCAYLNPGDGKVHVACIVADTVNIIASIKAQLDMWKAPDMKDYCSEVGL